MEQSKSRHTPGPWLLDGRTIYTIHRLAHVETHRWSAQVQGYVGCPDEETDANARLIAAAPELLEALTALVALQDSIDPEGLFRGLESVMARAAIAKAAGA